MKFFIIGLLFHLATCYQPRQEEYKSDISRMDNYQDGPPLAYGDGNSRTNERYRSRLDVSAPGERNDVAPVDTYQPEGGTPRRQYRYSKPVGWGSGGRYGVGAETAGRGGGRGGSGRRPENNGDTWIEPAANAERRWETGEEDSRPLKSSLRRFRRRIGGLGVVDRSRESAKDGGGVSHGHSSDGVTVANSLTTVSTSTETAVASKNRSSLNDETTTVSVDESGQGSDNDSTESEGGTESDDKASFPWTWMEFFNPRKFVQAWSDIPRQYFTLLFGKANDMTKIDKKKWANMMKFFLE